VTGSKLPEAVSGVEPRSAVSGVRRFATAVLPVAAFALALGLLHHLLSEIHLRAIVDALHAVPVRNWLLSVGWTLVSYLALAIPDVLAIRVLGRPIGPRRILPTALIASAVGNNLGVAALSGGAVRYGYTPPRVCRLRRSPGWSASAR
jgi:uncharacterized membrane protein YbhN (UPF0104 family)